MLKRWALAPAAGIGGAVLGSALFGGAPSLVIGALLGVTTGAALIWLLSQDFLSSAWIDWAMTLARIALVLLMVTVAYGVVAGALIAVFFQHEASFEVYNRFYQLQGLMMLLIWLCGSPCLLIGVWYGLRRQWPQARFWLGLFFGPVLVFIVGEGLTPHLEIRWHQFVHTFFGLLPLAVLYYFALRRWHPNIIRHRRIARAQEA